MLAFAGIALQAQYNTNFINYRSTGRSVSVNMDFEAGSNGLSTSLVNRLLWGGHISDQVKEESARRLRQRNNLGLLLNYDLSAFVKGRRNFDILVGLKNQAVLNAAYSKDLYNLMFYGNERFRGRTADMSHASLNALRFQEFKVGLIMHKVDSIAKIGASISILKGEQLFYIRTLANSGLYTAADGSELVFESNFNMALSDTGNTGILGFNGLGAAADIFFETPYKSRLGKKCVLVVNANNIGFIHWWNHSVQYNSDSTLRFSGYHVNNISDLKDSTLNRINGDSILRSLTNARQEDFNVNIPTNLVIINRVLVSERFTFSFGFRHVFNANYRPYFFVEPELKIRNLSVTLHGGYGGYVTYNVGLSLAYNSPGWFLRLGSNSLQSFAFPKSAYAQGLFFTVARKMK